MSRATRGALIIATALLVMIGATAQSSSAQGSWYYSVTPPLGGPSFVVGYYNSARGCADWLGSAMYLHPSACHNHPTANNCRIIGNGYAYPENWPFPTANITSGTCFSGEHAVSKNRWWFFWYDSTGGSTVGGTSGEGKCEALRQKYLSSNRPGEAGSACFFIGNTYE